MNEDATRDLPGATAFEQRVLAEFASLRQEVTEVKQAINDVNARLTTLEARVETLEERVERRLTETRPMWEAVIAEQKRTNIKLDHLITDMYNLRTEFSMLASRVEHLEQART